MNKSGRKYGKVLIILVLVIMIYLSLLTIMGSFGMLMAFVDLRIIVFTIAPVVLFLLLSDLIADYIVAVKFMFGNKDFTTKELNASRIALIQSIKTVYITGGLGTFIGIMSLMTNLSEPSAIGPYMAVSIISALYALTINIVQIAMKHKIEKELMYRGTLMLSYSTNNNLLKNIVATEEIETTDDENLQSNELLEKLNLTRRENEIFELLVKGNSNRAISEELCIAETTIKKHIQNILKKAECGNRNELIKKYIGE